MLAAGEGAGVGWGEAAGAIPATVPGSGLPQPANQKKLITNVISARIGCFGFLFLLVTFFPGYLKRSSVIISTTTPGECYGYPLSIVHVRGMA